MCAIAVAVKQRVRLFGAAKCVENLFTGKRGSQRYSATREQLRIARHVRLDTKQLRRSECTKAPQAGEDLVCDQGHLLRLTDGSHCTLESRVDENHARSAMQHRLDNGRTHRTIGVQRSVGKRRSNERSISLTERTRITLCAKERVLRKAQRVCSHGTVRAKHSEPAR